MQEEKISGISKNIDLPRDRYFLLNGRDESYMGMLDKIMGFMNMQDEEDGYEGYDDYEDGYLDDEDEEPVQKKPRLLKNRQAAEEKAEPKVQRSAKITPMRQIRKKAEGTGREIYHFKPTAAGDACNIMDALMQDCSVVLNLEGVSQELAEKIIDTVSGCCYALSGKMMQISNYIFMVAPRSVGLNGEGQGNLVEDPFDLPMAVGRM